MKILPSGFMHEDSPVPDGMDLALAFAHANQPVIDSFLKQQRSDLEKASTNLQTLREKKAYLPGAIVAGISTVISIVAFGNGTQSGLSFLPFGLAGIIGGTSLGYVMVDKQEKSVLKLEQELQEIPRRPIPQTVSHLGKVHYVVNVLPFADGNIVVDATGRRQKQSMVYPEIPNVIHQLKSLQTQLTKIPNELPILLPGGDPSDLQARSRLRGVEADMGDILSMTNRIFDGTVDISAEIPVFPVRSNMVQSIRSASSHLIDGEPQFHLAKPDPSIEEAVNSISQTSAEIVEIRKSGLPDVKSLMTESVHRMDSCITQAKISRDKSLMNILSQSLEHINDIYDYPLTHFYCPKCHQTEQQRLANLPVSPDQLVEVPVEVLDSLHRSQDLRTLRRVMDNIRRNISQAEVDEQGHDFENTTILQTRLETYQNRFQGLAVEIPEFDPQIDRHKRNAVLKYNTLQKNGLVNYVAKVFRMSKLSGQEC